MNEKPENRREFLKQTALLGMGMYLGPPLVSKAFDKVQNSSRPDPLLDWTDWEKYRATVSHPCLTIKQKHFDFAKENIEKYDWAKAHFNRIHEILTNHIGLITDNFLEMMIEETTPGDPLWTPCPSCRDKGKPVHPHGLWKWEVSAPQRLTCTECDVVFPNEQYPEDIVLKTNWGKSQNIEFYGGE
ncbi:MAG: hypothetical protein WD431_22250, partial [Cyclobacteriaceae bacterium]